jgi:hypothetical protein
MCLWRCGRSWLWLLGVFWGEAWFKQFSKVGIVGFEPYCWYEILVLSSCVLLREVIENMCERAHVGFYVFA